ncbi:MAG TPA: sulfur carrier protein ThiS [Nocardioidaceae bacterium]|nr:sulfur carrier protein ThiS [Nocardioidaceae bacterium]
MRVTVNGEPHDLVTEETLAALVTRFADRTSGMAVAVNNAVVPRACWTTTRLAPGDRIELLTAVQGG